MQPKKVQLGNKVLILGKISFAEVTIPESRDSMGQTVLRIIIDGHHQRFTGADALLLWVAIQDGSQVLSVPDSDDYLNSFCDQE